MQGIFQKENTDKVLKYGIYRHLPTYEKIIRNLVSFSNNNTIKKEKDFFLLYQRSVLHAKAQNKTGAEKIPAPVLQIYLHFYAFFCTADALSCPSFTSMRIVSPALTPSARISFAASVSTCFCRYLLSGLAPYTGS